MQDETQLFGVRQLEDPVTQQGKDGQHTACSMIRAQYDGAAA